MLIIVLIPTLFSSSSFATASTQCSTFWLLEPPWNSSTHTLAAWVPFSKAAPRRGIETQQVPITEADSQLHHCLGSSLRFPKAESLRASGKNWAPSLSPLKEPNTYLVTSKGPRHVILCTDFEIYAFVYSLSILCCFIYLKILSNAVTFLYCAVCD